MDYVTRSARRGTNCTTKSKRSCQGCNRKRFPDRRRGGFSHSITVSHADLLRRGTTILRRVLASRGRRAFPTDGFQKSLAALEISAFAQDGESFTPRSKVQQTSTKSAT